MDSFQIREKFLNFFKERGHVIVPSSSLIPDDQSVLLTTAGMQQFKPYFVGKADPMKDFGNKNTASVQKCFRTSDIDEVGDESHLTFFEMLGNFSFGGYFKKEAIKLAYELLTTHYLLPAAEMSVTVFGGDPSASSGQVVPRDDESVKIWSELGFGEEKGNLSFSGREDNFWGPTGNEGPCGPTTEIYVKNAARRSIEIWNIVFNEYYCHPDGKLSKLKTPGVDTGMGLERLAMVLQKKNSIFETDLFASIMELLPNDLEERVRRIIVDHARGIAFLLSDGVRPSNKEAGYVLRRLMRRIFAYEHLYGLRPDTLEELLKLVIENYGDFYLELKDGRNESINSMWAEREKFMKSVKTGLKELQKSEKLDAGAAFKLYESYGLPYEVIKELGGKKTGDLKREDFDAEFKKHQEKSRAGAEKKFGGHGLILDTGELKAANEEELKKVIRLHTATHLLQKALRNVLGDEVKQAGSDITAERTRFDFTFPRKLTAEEIKKVEAEVNEIIKKNLPVNFKEMPIEEAKKTGALYFFKEKYPERVKVYYVGESIESAWSKEFCGGPHVASTGEVGIFKILKEEAVSAGVRRIRAMAA